MSAYEGTRIGDMTLCSVCNRAIQLLRSRNPHTGIDVDFWVHFASLDIKGPPETHKAVPKRCWSDYDCYGNPLTDRAVVVCTDNQPQEGQ